MITTTGYDGIGNAVLRIDGRSNRTTCTFDLANRQTGRRYPDGTRVTQVYEERKKGTGPFIRVDME